MVSIHEDPRSNLKRIHDASLLRARLSANDRDFEVKLDAHKEAVNASEVMRGVLPHEIVASEVCDSTKTAMGAEFEASYFRLVWETVYLPKDGPIRPSMMLRALALRRLVEPAAVSSEQLLLQDSQPDSLALLGAVAATGGSSSGDTQPTAPGSGYRMPIDDFEDGASVVEQEMGMEYYPVEEDSSKIDFKKKYEEAIQMAESASSTREQIAALTKVIALKSAEGSGRSRPPLLKTQMLPSHLLKSFDFGVSDISFDEHIEQLEDFLMNQPDDDFTKT
eukprot:SAG11_NODE_1068_length_5979_cov_9.282653_3_plen_278_part_00